MNNQQYVVILTLTDLNPDEFHNSPFIHSLDKCEGSFNTVEDPLVEFVCPRKFESI